MRMSHSIWVSLAETLAASRVAALLPLTRPAALGFSGRDAFGKNDASRCSSYTQLLTYPTNIRYKPFASFHFSAESTRHLLSGL